MKREKILLRGIGAAGVALDLDGALALTGCRQIISQLHPQEMIHLGAEGLFDSERHIGGQRAAFIEQVRIEQDR